MLSRRVFQEMLIAVGVSAGVVGVATMGLLYAAPKLFPPPAPAAAPVKVVQAPAPPQTCVMDRKAVFELTSISRDAYKQFATLQRDMQARIVAEKNRIDASETDPARAQQLIAELQTRMADQNGRLDAVRTEAIGLMIKRVSPVIATVGEAAKCGAVMDRASFIYVGKTKDITAEIVKLVERDIPPLEAGLIAELYKKQK